MAFEKIVEYGYDALGYVSDRAVVANVAIGQSALYASLSSLSSGNGANSFLCGIIGALAITSAYASYRFEKKMTKHIG